MPTNILFTQNNYETSTGKLVYSVPGQLPIAKSEVALTNFSFYNSFFNISATIGNNVLSFNHPINTAGTLQNNTLVLADGFYSIGDINNALQLRLVQLGLYLIDPSSGRNIYFLELVVNATRYCTQWNTYYLPTEAQRVTLGWTIPTSGVTVMTLSTTASNSPRFLGLLFSSTLNSLLGLTGVEITPSISTTLVTPWRNAPAQIGLGTLAPQINRVVSIIVRCSLVNNASSNPVDMLAQVPVSSAFGALTKFDAAFPTFTDAMTGSFNQIVLSFLDQNLRPLIFFDPEITATVQIRTL